MCLNITNSIHKNPVDKTPISKINGYIFLAPPIVLLVAVVVVEGEYVVGPEGVLRGQGICDWYWWEWFLVIRGGALGGGRLLFSVLKLVSIGWRVLKLIG